jgi:hypothetical protein
VNKVFLETAAPLYAELTLLLELAMAVGLVIGAWQDARLQDQSVPGRSGREG